MSAVASKKRFKSLPKPWIPHDYQKRAVKWLLQRSAAALFLQPGLGKTSITLFAFKLLIEAKKAKRMLVIAPLRVAQEVWPAEVNEWEEFKHLRVGVYHGDARKNFDFNAYDVVVVNPEGVQMLVFGSTSARTFNAKRWAAMGFDTLAVDELSKFKNPQSVRFKAMKKVLGTFKRRWGLTGSPMANGLLDLFGQMYMLDDGVALGEYITHYRMNYFYQPIGQQWTWKPTKESEKRIFHRIKDIALSMTTEEYLKLPPVIETFTELILPPAVRKIYDQVENDLIAGVKSGLIVSANAAAATGKLRQICNGGVYGMDDDEKAVVHELHSVKVDWLRDLIEELQGAPLLIAYEFRHDLARIQKAFPDMQNIGGGTSGKQVRELVAAWNNNELQYLAVHPASAGHGLNMQKGHAAHLAHFSGMWDFELYDQLFRRIWRQGNDAAKVFRYHAVMKDTVDEDQRTALRRKDKGQAGCFKALMDRRK